MALDEVTQVCPVDLPVMLSDSAGKGVLIMAVCHSKSQLEQRWGKHGADTVWACSGTKVLLGRSPTRTRWRLRRNCAATPRPATAREAVVAPELLRMLPDWRALVIRMNLHPIVVKVRPAWRRLPYRLGRHPLPVPRPLPTLLRMLELPDLPDMMPAAAAEPELIGSANGHRRPAQGHGARS
jgi:hypothetical protein